MKKLTLLVLLNCFHFLGSSQQLTLISENFDDNRFGWAIVKQDSVDIDVNGGKYWIDNRKLIGHLAGKKLDILNGMNFSVETELILTSGREDYGHGFYYGRKDNDNQILFQITGNGYYYVSYEKDNNITELSGGWKISDVIKKGYNQPNVLKVVKEGNTHTFYINGTYITSYSFSWDFTDRFVQLVVQNRQKVAYDNFSVKVWSSDNTIPGKINSGYTSPLALQVASKATPPKEGRAKVFSVNINGNYKYGIMDKNGYRIVDAVNQYFGDFDKNGRTAMKKDTTYGLIDENANLLTPFVLRYIGFGNDGVSYAYIKKYGAIDKDGKTVLPFVYDKLGDYSEGLFYAELNGKAGIIDRTGKEVIAFGKIGRSSSYFPRFTNGLIVVKDTVEKSEGLMNQKGQWVIEPGRYASVYSYSKDFIKVTINHPTQYGKKLHGLLSENGREIFPPKYGDIRIEENFIIIGNEECDLGLSYTKSEKCLLALATKSGKILTPFKYSEIYAAWRGSKYPLVFVGSKNMFFDFPKGGHMGYVDGNGKEIIPPVYENRNNSTYLSFDTRPYLYEYQEGLFNLSKDGKWGYMDDKQNVVIPFQYEWASPFKNGKAKVTLNGEEFFIDKTGKKTTVPVEKDENDYNYTTLPPIRTM